MPSDPPQHVWVVRLKPGGMEVPVADKRAAEVFRERGCKVTEVPLAAVSEGVGLRCLGIRQER